MDNQPTSPSREEADLRPCPFCGGAVALESIPTKCIHSVDCNDGCGITGPIKETASEAIAAWNSRTASPSVQEQAGQSGNGITVDKGALTMALNVLRRAGKDEVADALVASVVEQISAQAGQSKTEASVEGAVSCPDCDGDGMFSMVPGGDKDHVCPLCQGTGKVPRAEVTRLASGPKGGEPLSDAQISAGLKEANRMDGTFDFGDGSTAVEREAARVAAFRLGTKGLK